MLLILAAISLSAVFSDKGVFSRAENAGAKYNEAKAREVLETVLLADGQYEKNINPEYNQDRFLDELIKSEIPGSKVIEDVAIVDGYGYELDRSVPKIGRYIGKEEELIFPTVTATAQLTEDKKNAIINITAIEEKNGINKIEIWINGEKIAEYPYDNVKTEITVNPPYIATQNGEYTIKAYGDLMASTTVEVTGIMPGIEFEPNGNTTWEKEHSTKIKLQETEEKIVQLKQLIDEAIQYMTKRVELMLKGLKMNHTEIVLTEIVKTTGEIKDCFRFSYDEKDYKYLSLSERVRAGLEVSMLLQRLSGRNYPIFVDNGESICSFGKVQPSGQVMISKVVNNQTLQVTYKNRK